MNVPKLRFSEFNDEWKIVNLSEILEFYSTNSLSREQLSDKGLLKNIHYGDIHKLYNSTIKEDDIITYVKDINFNKYTLCKTGDLLIADASEDYEGIGKATEIIEIKDNNVISGLHTIHARDVKNKFALGFKGYYFNSPIIHNQIRVLANGFKVFGISKNTICNLKTKIPSTSEQTKIVKTLELLDKKIELQSKKIEDLKLYKICLIKSCFKQSDLERVKLKKICNCSSSTLSMDDIEFNNGIYNVYGATGVIKKINSYQFESEALAIIKDGASVGKTIICDEKSSILGTLNMLKSDIYSPYYLEMILANINFTKYTVGSGIPHIYFKDYSNELVSIHNEEKAKKISDLYRFLLNKIELENNKLNKLQELKKGLMQSIFV